MPGLSASEIHPASRYAGDTIDYYSRAFVADDPRGHHSTVVLRVAQAGAADYPIDVDTEELCAYTHTSGGCSAQPRSSAFSKAISGVIRGEVESVLGGQGCGSEEFVPVSSESEDEPDLQSVAAKPLLPPSSYAGIDGIALDDIADTIATTYIGGVCEDSSIWMTQATETPDPEPPLACSDEIPSSVSGTDTRDPTMARRVHHHQREIFHARESLRPRQFLRRRFRATRTCLTHIKEA
ncbi:hypothetical protein GQ600_19699 [Phytophthora cactorum]|nr:hypothetical protein GQ600_19699 [Phytophthora cactorum]